MIRQEVFMPMTTKAIVDAALQLTEPERAEIVSQLLDTLSETSENIATDDPGFIEEMERRFADPSGAVPWSELRSEVQP
jgi:hypothetical protein